MIVSGILSFCAMSLTAQNSTNSPYTRYGYGELANRSFGAGRSMGGVGIGLRSSKQINPMNPASYSSMDSMTFLFDFGASAQLSWFKDGTNKQNDVNGNVDYMAMQFPLCKQMAMSIGLLPYSHVGYKFGESKTTDDQEYIEAFDGTGGLNQLYAGLSVDIWKKRLSIGANIIYLFGSNTHNATTYYTSSTSTNIYSIRKLKIHDVMFDFGAQYTHPLSKTDNLIIGLVYTPQKKLANKTYETIRNGTNSSYADVVSGDTTTHLRYDIPNGYGIGLSYVRKDKFIAAVDYAYQDWSNASFAGEKGQFKNRSKVAAGFEYIPNLYSRPYMNRMRYRVGASYTNSYIQVNGHDYKEYGATVGLGFPISDARSFINVSFEYVKIKPNVHTMIDENYLRMTLSYTFNEHWFFKRKVD